MFQIWQCKPNTSLQIPNANLPGIKLYLTAVQCNE